MLPVLNYHLDLNCERYDRPHPEATRHIKEEHISREFATTMFTKNRSQKDTYTCHQKKKLKFLGYIIRKVYLKNLKIRVLIEGKRGRDKN